MKFFVLSVLVLGLQAFGQTSFQQLETDYRRALGPKTKGGLGTWAGHCIHSHDPEKKWPAVYVNRTILDKESNLEKSTQTYFWEKTEDIHYFKKFTLSELNRYQPYVTWAQKEQWTSVEMVEDALTNTFQLSQGGTIIRSLRINETEWSKTYLLQVARKKDQQMEVLSYCEFSTPMRDVPEYTPAPVSIHTGAMANTWVELKLPAQKAPITRLGIRKRMGEQIGISRVQILTDTGKVLSYGETVFGAGNEMAFGDNGLFFRPAGITFYISGFASDLEIYGAAR
jgi:hypothetical protein